MIQTTLKILPTQVATLLEIGENGDDIVEIHTRVLVLVILLVQNQVLVAHAMIRISRVPHTGEESIALRATRTGEESIILRATHTGEDDIIIA